MSVFRPAHHIPRLPVAGTEPEFIKMFDPPTGNIPGDVPLPEALSLDALDASPTGPKPNPVPEIMQAQGLLQVSSPHTVQRDLLNGLTIRTWDNAKNLIFFTIRDGDLKSPFNAGVYPGPTTRVPRGAVFHCEMQGKGPPPHTIHWHGIEPTPLNDGVGHCSIELGHIIYQWQPNFIGTYFYHCHRNTMQHFNFGLYGLLLIEPPDAYFASIASKNPDNTVNLNAIPVGACSDGKYRTAANVAQFPQFTGFVGGPPVHGVANLDPHAYTVPYDVEALWVLADRDSVWSDLGSNAFATFPKHGADPGINDDFQANPGSGGFFNFNDYVADYWFITGVPVPAAKGGVGTINPAGPAPTGGGLPGGLIPPAWNSGKSGTMVAINAQVGQTILVRQLDGAYNWAKTTFPVDVVVIAWDGRALGVPPFGRYNSAYLVPAGTPIINSTARRFDVIMKPTQAMNDFATVEFFDNRGGAKTVTAKIPFNII